MTLITLVCLAALTVILERTLHVAATLNVHRYHGHPWRFAALAGYWALLSAGALAVTLGLPLGGPLLLVALALLKLTDRRRT